MTSTDFETRQAPEPWSLLARAVWTVARDNDQFKMLSLGAHHAMMELGRKETVFLLDWDEERSEQLERHLQGLMRHYNEGKRLVAGLVGGGVEARRVLKRARPLMTRVKVGLIHIETSGEVWSRDAGWVAQLFFQGFDRAPDPPRDEWAELLRQSEPDRLKFAAQANETVAFAGVMSSRPVVATWALAVAILGVFGLELAFGGSQSAAVLIRMGALSPERVFGGEIWRLFSCTFLHSGWSHLFFNLFVLVVLGTSLERVLGFWRFLVLWGLSCLGASALSLVFLDGFSVGASGGLWGLLGAEAVLAWRSKGLLPQKVIQPARRAATFNLVINLVNSFRPHVDLFGHLGGGIVGAALMVSGILTRDLPRLGKGETKGGPMTAEEASIPDHPRLKALGSLLAATLLAGLALGLWSGKAWTLENPIESTRTPIPSLGVSLDLPKGLGLKPGSPGEAPSVVVGDLLSDPGAIIITRYSTTLTDEAARSSEFEAIGEALAEPPSGAQVITGPEILSIGGSRGLVVRYRFASGLEEELAFVLLDGDLLKADSLRWPVFGNAVPEGHSVRILESLRPLAEGADIPTGD